MLNIDFIGLSKIISHALRHQPCLYGIELDKDGWVDIEVLIVGIKKFTGNYNELTMQVIEQMIESSIKKRHEILNKKIRASYGHSLEYKIIKKTCIPPPYLYHGTREDALESIFSEGLSSMKRQYVHLSERKEEARKIALRKTKSPVILKIDSQKAAKNGILFYKEINDLWLSDKIEPIYLKIDS